MSECPCLCSRPQTISALGFGYVPSKSQGFILQLLYASCTCFHNYIIKYCTEWWYVSGKRKNCVNLVTKLNTVERLNKCELLKFQCDKKLFTLAIHPTVYEYLLSTFMCQPGFQTLETHRGVKQCSPLSLLIIPCVIRQVNTLSYCPSKHTEGPVGDTQYNLGIGRTPWRRLQLSRNLKGGDC